MKLLKKILFQYLFVCFLGVILHFTYDWSNKNFFVGLFSATNESTWEHLKLVFFPMLILIIINYFISQKDTQTIDDFSKMLSSSTFGILFSMLSTITLFYTYTGVIGKNIDFFNILIYFISVALGFYLQNKLMKRNYFIKPFTSILILLIFTVLFFHFTYNTPNIGIFMEPQI